MPVSFVSAGTGQRERKPGRSIRASSGFGPPVAPARTSTTVIGGVLLLAVAGLVFISTYFADRALTSSQPAALFATPQRPGYPLAAAAPPPGAVSDIDVLALPALEPAARRSIATWAGSQSNRPVAASPQKPSPLPKGEIPIPTSQVVPRVGIAQTTPQAALDKLDPSLLVTRGDEYFARSDVVAARLLYRRAVDGGSAMGAAALAASFDPILLEQRGIRGVRDDPAAALYWYSAARTMGDTAAEAHAAALMERLRWAASRGDMKARAILNQPLR